MIDFHHKEPYIGGICQVENGLMPIKRNALNVSDLLIIVHLFVGNTHLLQKNIVSEYPKRKREVKTFNGGSGVKKRQIGEEGKCQRFYCFGVLGDTKNGGK